MSKGFTLIEIMIVVAIISILASISVPVMGSYVDSAHESKLVKAVSSIKKQVSFNAIASGGSVQKDFSGVDLNELPKGIEVGNGGSNLISLKSGRVEFEVTLDPNTGKIEYIKKES